ncbi:unnamed protein product [Leptosia nina]|uniref:Uncharacterized protein n=1 Tax=Leptosia nina TaxID=320188 RepID=A0AAV1J9X4_9NEOP
MAERGARVILACRNEEKALDAVKQIRILTRNEDVHYQNLDLASFDSVRKFATRILNSQKRLDVLVNNAGVVDGVNQKTEDGYSLMIQSNYLSSFLLTMLLLPLLKASPPSRVISLSSFTHKYVNINPEELSTIPQGWNPMLNNIWYFRSKLCIVLMTVELARHLKDSGVTANCLHPGVVNTNMLNNINVTIIRLFMKVIRSLVKTSWEGAQTAIYLATSPEVESSGGYYAECKLTNPSRTACNVELAKRLWDTTERLVNFY